MAQVENKNLVNFVAALDVDRLAEACIGWGTDDTEFITLLATRSKRHLARVSRMYREGYDKDLLMLIEEETSGWCDYS